MKVVALIIFLLLGFVSDCRSQENQDSINQLYFDEEDRNCKAACNEVVRLIQQSNIKELAYHILYPIQRLFPLPNVTNPEEFIALYTLFFDSTIKSRIELYDSSHEIIEKNGFCGCGGGIVWVTD